MAVYLLFKKIQKQPPKIVLKNFAIFAEVEKQMEAVVQRSSVKKVFSEISHNSGEHLRQSLFFNKVAGLRLATLLKKRLWHKCFPVNFGKFRRTPFFKEHLWWLLLSITPVLQFVFKSQYCKIFKCTYFEEHLQTAASENLFIKLRRIKNYS